MKLRLSGNLLSGLLFTLLGVAALVYASRYPLGTASRMGAGYFPRLISIGLIAVGAVLLAKSLRAGEVAATFDGLRPLLFVLLGTLAFGLLIEDGGLLLAGASLVTLARFGSDDIRPVEVIVLTAALILSAALLFNRALGLPIPILPSW